MPTRQEIRRFAADPEKFFGSIKMPHCGGRKTLAESAADFQREWLASVTPSLLSVARGEKPAIGRFWTERTKGGSKDSDIGMVLLWLLAFSPRPLSIQVAAGKRDQAAETKKAVQSWLHYNPWLAKRIELLNWQIVCKATGSGAEVLSADESGGAAVASLKRNSVAECSR